MSQLHELKSDPKPFQDVWSTRKKFDFRKDDRGFAVNDVLHLREHVREGTVGEHKGYTGRGVLLLVIHLIRGPAYDIPEGYVCMSINMLTRLTADQEKEGMGP